MARFAPALRGRLRISLLSATRSKLVITFPLNHGFWRRMGDGGRPPEVSMQMRASNRPDAAVAQKATVVSDLGKGVRIGHQVSVEKVNESEPSEDAS